MCRTTDHYHYHNPSHHRHGDSTETDPFTITSFLLQLSASDSELDSHNDAESSPLIRERFDFPAETVPTVFKQHHSKKLCRTKNKVLNLEDIPEETELRCSDDGDESDDVNLPELDEVCENLEMDLQVLRKSLDMGIWVLCLGFGYMVSRASITKFRSRLKFS